MVLAVAVATLVLAGHKIVERVVHGMVFWRQTQQMNRQGPLLFLLEYLLVVPSPLAVFVVVVFFRQIQIVSDAFVVPTAVIVEDDGLDAGVQVLFDVL